MEPSGTQNTNFWTDQGQNTNFWTDHRQYQSIEGHKATGQIKDRRTKPKLMDRLGTDQGFYIGQFTGFNVLDRQGSGTRDRTKVLCRSGKEPKLLDRSRAEPKLLDRRGTEGA
jgi:hypothetical protein